MKLNITHNFATDKSSFFRKIILSITVLIILFIYSVKFDTFHYNFPLFTKFNYNFWGIFIQAFPFILAGSILSSIIALFVKEEFIVKILTKSKTGSIIAPLAASFFIPICDCASVLIASRLAKKNIPIKSLVIYMLVAPILNPIVIASTAFAFPANAEIIFYRIGGGIAISIIVGFIIQYFFHTDSSKILLPQKFIIKPKCSCSSCSPGNDFVMVKNNKTTSTKNILSKINKVLIHTGDEFFHVAPFVIAGAIISSGFQTFIPRSFFTESFDLSHIFIEAAIMLCMGFILSVCSTSDAFIGKAFNTHFSISSILGFMILGPMIDIKNIIMLSSYFKKRFIAVLALSVFITTYIFIILISLLK